MNNTLNETLQKVEAAYPGLFLTTKLVLATAATTRLDRKHPLAVILIGGPSSGKTSLLMPLTRCKDLQNLKNGVIRLDNFSPASLLSHASNKTEDQLKKIDLIPKMQNRVVIVKEMAPWFSGNEDDLNKRFAIFASVMDGEGFVSASGSHGTRSYDDPCIFTLAGAVTYDVLTPHVFKSMSAIGPRFNFWAMPRRDSDPRKWKSPAANRKEVEATAQNAIASFVDQLFEKHPVGSINYEQFNMPQILRDQLDRAASLMALGRSKQTFQNQDGTDAAELETASESPERAFSYLQQLAYASALIDGRWEITAQDLALPIGVAVSSAFTPIRKIISTFMRQRRSRTVSDLAAYTRMSEDTARKYANNLTSCGLLERVNPDGTTTWDLAPEFQQLREIWLEANGDKKPPSGALGETNEILQQSFGLNGHSPPQI